MESLRTAMELLDTVVSTDNAKKFIVRYDDELVGEITYISYPNKDIVCCPTQTACRMGCKFCFLSNEGKNLAYRSLQAGEITRLVGIATQDANFRKPLLVSFMGAGEPLLNYKEMLQSASQLQQIHGVKGVRFAFATMLPKGMETSFLQLTDLVARTGLNFKAHLSLHFTCNTLRQRYMPAAGDLKTAVSLLETYKRVTGRDVEVHYTLMEGVNDSPGNANALDELLSPREIPVKVLHYSENPQLDAKRSSVPEKFVALLKTNGLQAEYYRPNGLDIGASCGQFNLEHYVKVGDGRSAQK